MNDENTNADRQRPPEVRSTELLAAKIATELRSNYLVIAHDGDGLHGEHYPVDNAELAKDICVLLLANAQAERLKDSIDSLTESIRDLSEIVRLKGENN